MGKAFALQQDALHCELRSSDGVLHGGDRGEVNEQIFIEMLRRYLPNRYTVDKAMVMDSRGNTSDSIDVVVFDRQYTPTLLDRDKHRYVPAESVYAVFECKPTINKSYLDYAADKALSVRRLLRTSVPIKHAGGIFPAKKPGHIVAGILAIEVEWADGLGEAFRENHGLLNGDRQLDCGFASAGAAFDVFEEGGSYTFAPEGNALAFFAFRLLARLQALATVPAVDWSSYAELLGETQPANCHV